NQSSGADTFLEATSCSTVSATRASASTRNNTTIDANNSRETVFSQAKHRTFGDPHGTTSFRKHAVYVWLPLIVISHDCSAKGHEVFAAVAVASTLMTINRTTHDDISQDASSKYLYANKQYRNR